MRGLNYIIPIAIAVLMLFQSCRLVERSSDNDDKIEELKRHAMQQMLDHPRVSDYHRWEIFTSIRNNGGDVPIPEKPELTEDEMKKLAFHHDIVARKDKLVYERKSDIMWACYWLAMAFGIIALMSAPVGAVCSGFWGFLAILFAVVGWCSGPG